MAGNTSVCSSYMVLKPERLGFSDPLRILISCNLEKRTFVESSYREEEDFDLRWIIFVSIVVQKFLQFVAKPMSIFGSTIEFFLNILSSNQNLGVLLLNFLRGKPVVMPDKNSASFLSFVGHLDKRAELDSSIKYGDERYFAALSMMASKASYENKAYIETTVTEKWKMEFLGSYDYWNDFQEKAATQAFMLYDRNEHGQDTIVVSFRGTEPFDADAWCTDFDISWYEIDGIGKVHAGFSKALGLLVNVNGWPKYIDKQQDDRPAPLAYYAIRDMLKELLSKNDRAKYIVTGHSLGGALAILFAAILAMNEETELLERLEGVYTFGQPRIGDQKFVEFVEKKFKENAIYYARFVYSNDIVPRLPFDDSELMFKHFGPCLYYNSLYQGKLVAEVPNKNYFAPLEAIPKVINAVRELIRSFTLSRSKGPDYKEGWLLRVFRVIGLIAPGIPAHCTQDYVNATRLGFADILFHPTRS